MLPFQIFVPGIGVVAEGSTADIALQLAQAKGYKSEEMVVKFKQDTRILST